jgi:hypothetical protein
VALQGALEVLLNLERKTGGQTVVQNVTKQLVAEDPMEDGTVSHVSNAHSHRRQGRRLPPTSEVAELQFVNVNCTGCIRGTRKIFNFKFIPDFCPLQHVH